MRSNAVCVLAGLVLSSAAVAQDIHWLEPKGGSWLNPVNWSPANVPDIATENALLGLSGPYTVVIDQTGELNIGSLRVLSPEATLRISGPAGGTRYLVLNGPLLENQGTVVVNPDSLPGRFGLVMRATLTLAGAGEVVLNAPESDLAAALLSHFSDGTTRCIIGPEQTVRGAGHIIDAINNGLIIAGQNGRTLRLRGTELDNNSLITAANGGRIEIQAPTCRQGPEGRILADAGPIMLQMTSITGGTLESANAGGFFASNTMDVTGVAIDGDLTIMNNVLLNIPTGSLVNNGTMTIGPGTPGVLTWLYFRTDSALQGTGRIVLEATNGDTASARVFRGTFGTALTHGPGHTIGGTGRVEVGALANQGSIIADRPGEILQVDVHSCIHTGILGATNGGILQVRASQFTPSTGVFRADGGDIQVSGDLRGQTMESFNGGRFMVVPQRGLAVHDLTLRGTFLVYPGREFIINGPITSSGSFIVNPDGVNTPTTMNLAYAITGPGSIVLNAHPSSLASATITATLSPSFQNLGGHVVRGTGIIFPSFTNAGAVLADRPGLVLEVRSPSVTSSGDLRAEAGATLRLAGATILQDNGGIITGDGADAGVEFLGGSVVRLGRIDLANGALARIGGGVTTFQDVRLSGPLRIDPGASLRISGATLTNNGVITIGDGENAQAAGITMIAPVAIAGTGSMVLRAHPDRLDGAVLGTFTGGSATNRAGHVIAGTGLIADSIVNLGVIAPGDPGGGIGRIHCEGDYHCGGTSRHVFDLSAEGAAPIGDLFSVAGLAQLTGTLEVRFSADAPPAPGTSVVIVEASELSGRFASVVLPQLPAGAGVVRVRYGPGEVRVLVPLCAADWNAEDGVNTQDFFDFLAALFASSSLADFNQDGRTNSQDFFDFLGAFFAGC